MTDQTGSIYNAYDGNNNAFHALADNRAGQAVFRIDDESFENKIRAYQRDFYDNSPNPSRYIRSRTTAMVRKIYENCNIITVVYDTGSGTEPVTEKYCWQYGISFYHARFFAALMGTETFIYKDCNTITVYEDNSPHGTITLNPESHFFEPFGIRAVFELMFRLLDMQRRILSISIPKGIFLTYEQRPYIHCAGMYIPRKAYKELMESEPVVYVRNPYTSAVHSKNGQAARIEPPNTDEPEHDPRDKPKHIRNRCRRLVKNAGVLILCQPEDSGECAGTDAAGGLSVQAAAVQKALDEQAGNSGMEYKTLVFQFLAEDDTPEQKSVTGFYVQLDCGYSRYAPAVSAARAAGIAAVLYVPKTAMHRSMWIQIQVVGTEDAKPVFSIEMNDGHQVLSQLVSFLYSGGGTRCKRFLNMYYSE